MKRSIPTFFNPLLKMCGTCRYCTVEDPFNPGRLGYCCKKQTTVKLNVKKECWAIIGGKE